MTPRKTTRTTAARAARRTSAASTAKSAAASRTHTVARGSASGALRRPKESRFFAFFRQWGSSLFVILLVALLVHDIFGRNGFLDLRRSQQEVERLRRDITQLNEENRRLAERVNALKTDPKLIERIAREEMGLAKPGEYVFRVPPKK